MRFCTPVPASQAALSERQFRRKEMKIELLSRGGDGSTLAIILESSPSD
jgi:hypothetical protein